MLYQPNNKRSALKTLRIAAAIVIGALANLLRTRRDIAYLDGASPELLADVGLRRGDEGGYHQFK